MYVLYIQYSMCCMYVNETFRPILSYHTQVYVCTLHTYVWWFRWHPTYHRLKNKWNGVVLCVIKDRGGFGFGFGFR